MAEHIVFDGQIYDADENVPDLGSWEHTGNPGDQRRSYQGFSADVGKLPKYKSLLTGSTAYCLDTGDIYIYHAGKKMWSRQ